MKTIFIRLISAILLTVLLAGCSAMPGATPTPTPQPVVIVSEDTISASAKVVAAKWANLSFMMGGPEFILYYDVGDTVKDGDKLAELSPDALPQSIILAEADLLSARRALDDLLVSTSACYQAEQNVVRAKRALEEAQKDIDRTKFRRGSDDLIDQTEAEIDLAKKQLTFAKDSYRRVQNRPDGDSLKAEAQLAMTNAQLRLDSLIAKLNWLTGKPSDLDIAEANAAFALAQANLADAEREYERLKDGPDPDALAVAEARIKSLEVVINQKYLLVPFDGTIVEKYVRSGESISPGAPVVLLADLSTLVVETTDLSEVDVARITEGDLVKVTFDALPDAVVNGKVSKIALKNTAGSGVYYTVTITLEEVPSALRWGMSAFVEIKLGK